MQYTEENMMDEKSHHGVGPCPWPCLEGGKDSGENALLPNNNITTDSGIASLRKVSKIGAWKSQNHGIQFDEL
jgi:hypothetical protein